MSEQYIVIKNKEIPHEINAMLSWKPKNKKKNLTLVIFILEACGALATKGYDAIVQKGLC